MRSGYAEVPYPWRAAVARGTSAPARHYATIAAQAVRYGLPARRRPAAVWTRVARHRLPVGALAQIVSRLPGHERPDLDDLLSDVRATWPELAGRSGALLPATPPASLSALSLERRAARTVFVFGEGAAPLLVLKVDTAGGAQPAREAAALRAVEPARVGPVDLGRVGTAYAQSVVPGAPLRVRPLEPAGARGLTPPACLENAYAGLERLGAATAADGPPTDVRDLLECAAAHPELGDRARRALLAASARIGRLDRCVLAHRDASPQNLHCAGDRLAGLVDWELAEPRWLPGFDTWVAAVSYLEHCVGMVRWSDDAVLAVFDAAWTHSPYFERSRAAARSAVAAVGLDPADAEALELAFFGLRLAHRARHPEAWATSARTAARMLDTAAAG